MDQFPSNSRRPPRTNDEPKKIERVITGEVIRRKTPLGRRMSQNLFGGDVQSIWGYVVGDVLIPAFRDMVYDATIGSLERAIFPDSNIRRGGRRPGYTNYNNRYSSPGGGNRSGRDRDGRRELSRHARASHSFDEIILETRVEAQEILDRLFDWLERYDQVSVAELYEMVGISSNFVDRKWGWTDLHNAGVSRAGRGYLLNLPRPEPLD